MKPINEMNMHWDELNIDKNMKKKKDTESKIPTSLYRWFFTVVHESEKKDENERVKLLSPSKDSEDGQSTEFCIKHKGVKYSVTISIK